MTLGGLINNLETLPVVVKQEIDDIVMSDSSILNREQLSKGKRADDGNIISGKTGRSTYSPAYKKLKARKGLQNKFIDLKFTGEFHKSIETRKKGTNTYENVSGDSLYLQELKPKFGSELLGLNKILLQELKN